VPAADAPRPTALGTAFVQGNHLELLVD